MTKTNIMQAWDGILPDTAADQRMLHAILAYQNAYQRKRRIRQRLMTAVPAAGCLLLGAGFGLHHYHMTRPLTMTLSSGEQIVYRVLHGSVGDAVYVYPEDGGSRALTAEELHMLLPCAAQPDPCVAVFHTGTGDFIHAETKIGDVHVHLSKDGFPVTDVIVTGTQTYTDICGVPVTFGYFLTDPNSRGIRTAILYASYTRADLQIYLETGCKEADSEATGTALGELVYEMLEADAPDLSAIKYQG
ncbi:MAG: hypothetical protein J6Z40_14365 [Oscillospiraceae bacterium]|nr:hypothetical protein [Oscillospiraceae bacterium]